MPVSIQRELFLDVLGELIPLWNIHYEETAAHVRGLPFALDWPSILTLASQGRVALFTVRNEEWELVGYSVFEIVKYVQHNNYICAQNEGLYLKPDYRKGLTALRLLEHAELDFTSNKISAIRYSSVPTFMAKKGGLGKLYKFFGARAIHTVYEKVLTKSTGGHRGRRRKVIKRTGKPIHGANVS